MPADSQPGNGGIYGVYSSGGSVTIGNQAVGPGARANMYTDAALAALSKVESLLRARPADAVDAAAAEKELSALEEELDPGCAGSADPAARLGMLRKLEHLVLPWTPLAKAVGELAAAVRAFTGH